MAVAWYAVQYFSGWNWISVDQTRGREKALDLQEFYNGSGFSYKYKCRVVRLDRHDGEAVEVLSDAPTEEEQQRKRAEHDRHLEELYATGRLERP